MLALQHFLDSRTLMLQAKTLMRTYWIVGKLEVGLVKLNVVTYTKCMSCINVMDTTIALQSDIMHRKISHVL